MDLSVCRKFRKGDKHWREYMEHYRLDYLAEIRSIEGCRNSAPNYDRDKLTPETLDNALGELPIPDPNNDYYSLEIDLGAEPEFAARLPEGWKLMGHDLSDGTHTSSLHAYLPWEGQLEPLTQRLNEFGLLSLADAELARKLLPLEWGDHDPHARVNIWALYEREEAVHKD